MIRGFFAGLLVLILAGCAGLQLKSDDQVVIDRAEKRMAALQAGDFKKAYSYMTPGYKATKSLERFQSEFAGGANITWFEVLNPECESERCVVTVTRKYKMQISARGEMGKAREFENNTQQVWIKVDGQWWYYKLN